MRDVNSEAGNLFLSDKYEKQFTDQFNWRIDWRDRKPTDTPVEGTLTLRIDLNERTLSYLLGDRNFGIARDSIEADVLVTMHVTVCINSGSVTFID